MSSLRRAQPLSAANRPSASGGGRSTDYIYCARDATPSRPNGLFLRPGGALGAPIAPDQRRARSNTRPIFYGIARRQIARFADGVHEPTRIYANATISFGSNTLILTVTSRASSIG